MDLKEVQRALAEYLQDFLLRSLPPGPLASYTIDLLGSPGLVLSNTPHSRLACGVLLCYGMLSPRDWERAVPAAAALELTNNAIELFDKFLDEEGFGKIIPQPQMEELNLASSLQSLAHTALAELEERGFPAAKVLGAHRALADIVLETNAAQDWDLRAEGKWLPFEESLALTIGKGAPLASGAGRLGAYLAVDDPGVVEACVAFGRAAGTYAQLLNDLRDAMPGHTLKSDVRKRRSTLPLVYFIRLEEDEFPEERALLQSSHELSCEEEERVRRAVQASGALDFTSTVAESYRLQARQALAPLASTYDTALLLRAFLGEE